MQSFIVRIYRRESAKAGRFLGIVEISGRRGKTAFSGYDELWRILITGEGGSKVKRPGRKREAGRRPGKRESGSAARRPQR